jgi:hypothetical protein
MGWPLPAYSVVRGEVFAGDWAKSVFKRQSRSVVKTTGELGFCATALTYPRGVGRRSREVNLHWHQCAGSMSLECSQLGPDRRKI